MNSAILLRALALGALASAGTMVRAELAAVALSENTAPAAAVHVDCRTGQDGNPGTRELPVHSLGRAAEILRRPDNAIYVIRLSPGIHVLDHHVSLATQKDVRGRRLVVEASVLPDDPAWTPDQMPIVVNSSDLGEISADTPSFVVSFLVEASHVTVRGIKFHGYARANSRYFPVARLDKKATDLRVEQCMFVADPNAAHIQVGVIAHGDGIKVEHCVFYQARNAVVFWEAAGDAPKTGNEFTHNIVIGAGQSAVWTAWPDGDFVFDENLVAGCKHVWVRNGENPARYAMQHSVLIKNIHRTGVSRSNGVQPEPFDLGEHDVVRADEIALRFAADVDQALPCDYLHPLHDTPGHELHAGLFHE